MADIFSGTYSSPQPAGSGASGLNYGAGGFRALGGVFSFMGKRDQAKAMRDQADEEARRQHLADSTRAATATGLGAASGIELGSLSLQTYLTAMQREMTRQREWARRAAYTSASNVENAAAAGLVTDFGKSMFGMGL